MHAIKKSIEILKYLNSRDSVDTYDRYLREELLDGISSKQLGRDLDALYGALDGYIIKEKIGKRHTYRISKHTERYRLLADAFESGIGLDLLFDMVQKGDAEEAIAELRERLDVQKSPYMFFNMPYEEIGDLSKDHNFISLKKAVELHEYRTIRLKGEKGYIFEDVKPIKLLFSEGNWYVAYVDTQDGLRFSRINFIQRVDYATNKIAYQKHSIHKHLEWLEQEFQNSFSSYGVPKQTATLYAKPNIAHYFEEGMKRFFRSQRFVEKDASGGVTFNVDYTQEMEVLPFVQRWMPDLLIVAPTALKEAYRKKLQAALDG